MQQLYENTPLFIGLDACYTLIMYAKFYVNWIYIFFFKLETHMFSKFLIYVNKM